MMRVVTGSEVEVGVYLRGEAGRLVRVRRAAQQRVDHPSQGHLLVVIALIVKEREPPKLRKVSHPHKLKSL